MKKTRVCRFQCKSRFKRKTGVLLGAVIFLFCFSVPFTKSFATNSKSVNAKSSWLALAEQAEPQADTTKQGVNDQIYQDDAKEEQAADGQELDEVVVTALGVKKVKSSLGYNISSVKGEKLESQGSSNALKSLEGKVTGVQINSLSPTPTSSVLLTVRGATSLGAISKGNTGNINNASQPLIVVDGIPVSTNGLSNVGSIDVGNYMSSINPNDIESISILKGASAAALYGSQAGNGVVLITTKSGAKGKKGIGVGFISSVSFDNAFSGVPIQRRFIQSGENGNADDSGTEDRKAYGWDINDTTNSVPEWNWNLLDQKWEKTTRTATGDANPLLAFLETGVTYENGVDITGNYDKGNYRFNYTNLVNESVIPGNKTTRNNISFSGLYKITEKASISSNSSFSHTFVPNQSQIQGNREDNPLAHSMAMPISMPNMATWRQANKWLNGYEGKYQNTAYLKNEGDDRLANLNSDGSDNSIGKNNPYFAAEEIIRTYVKDVFFTKFQFDYNIIKPLTFTARTGISHESFAFEKKTPWGTERATSGGYEQQHSNNLAVKNDLMLAFNNKFVADKLNVDALVGFAYNYGEANNSGFSGKQLITPNNYTYEALPASVRQSSTFYRGYATKDTGLYGTVTLGWQDMVFLDLSGRNDWTGILPYEQTSFFYPGASVSWIVTETFKEMGDWLNFFKVRAGYAETGYGLGTPPNRDSYGTSNDTWGGAALGTVGGSLIDPAGLKPELNVTTEAGFDFRVLKNRIYGDFTVYQKDHKNQIQELPVVSSTGFPSMLTNMGTVRSTGTEISITGVPIKTANWEWSLTVNSTTNRSVIYELDTRFEERFYDYEGSSKMALFKGSRVGDLYAAKPISYIQSGKYAGQMLIGKDGIIEESIQTTDNIRQNGYLGNINPDAILGFNTEVKYKNFNLGIVTSLRLGGIYISDTQKILIDDGSLDIPAAYGNDRYNEYFTGGRFVGGLPSMPNPDNVFTGPNDDAYSSVRDNMALYNGDPRYFGYWNAVFIDPDYIAAHPEAALPENKRNLPDEAYIKNGDDPNRTIYAHPYNMEGQELWSGAQFRTWDATNFKIKEINLTYRFDKNILNNIHAQNLSLTAFAKNVFFWAKNGMNEDPETAYRNGVDTMGISLFGLPPIWTMGLKLAAGF